ncbi:MAG: isoaspartyl peptidase/L-asparaginase [Pirellulales bacterium]
MTSNPFENSAAHHLPRYAIALHGGAGGSPRLWSETVCREKRAGLAEALDRGIQILSASGSALDAVEAVVRSLEDNPLFNAGRGCVLNEAGEHELDAAIMAGDKPSCGSVTGVKRVKNPVTLARRVMTDTPHVMLNAAGADQFAESIGLELADAEYFRTTDQIQQWQKWRARISGEATETDEPNDPSGSSVRYFGTVGCVAIDSSRCIAAATSTGGLTGKRWGRVGDTPIIGAGTYANNVSCGISCTGTGEEFIRHNVAADISARMRYAGASLASAVNTIIHEVLPADCGGLISVDRHYNIVMDYNTACMARAAADSSGHRAVLLERET